MKNINNTVERSIDTGEWDLEIKPSSGLFNLNLNEVWKYKDLLILFVKRDIVTVYKQTVLGPIWFFLQPLLTTFVFIVIFGDIAKLSTDGLPKILFYLSGVTLWNYFSECLTTTSKTFTENANIFGKVYFPRLIMPLAKVTSALIKFFIQLALLAGVYIYYLGFTNFTFTPNIFILLIPYLILLMACLGLGFGLMLSSFTTKYRDLTFLITFGVQLLMYAAPVVYPLSSVENPKYRLIIESNPMSFIIELFRFSLFGTNNLHVSGIIYSTVITFTILLLGIIIFNRAEKSFIDTV